MAVDPPQEHGPEARAARVRRTGIALVHSGELVLPAAGSEAEAARVAADDARAAVNYYFPVEIEVRMAPAPVDAEQIVQEALRRLAARLENR